MTAPTCPGYDEREGAFVAVCEYLEHPHCPSCLLLLSAEQECPICSPVAAARKALEDEK